MSGGVMGSPGKLRNEVMPLKVVDVYYHYFLRSFGLPYSMYRVEMTWKVGR